MEALNRKMQNQLKMVGTVEVPRKRLNRRETPSSVLAQITEPTSHDLVEIEKVAVPTLRELEAKMAEERLTAQAQLRQKSGFIVRLMRELGLMKEMGTCQGYTRQANPCKRPAIRQGFCRLHAPSVPAKKSLWQRLLPLSAAKY